MEGYFDPGAFPRPDPARHAGTAFNGQATFSGHVCVVGLPRADAAAMLPRGVHLLDGGCADPERHPLLFVFGEQAEGTLLVGGRPLPLGIAYGEFAALVPFVGQTRDPTPHVFVARMCSAYFPATWHGNAHYGFAKTTARMRTDGPLYVMTDDDDRLLLHAAVEPRGDWMPAATSTRPTLAALRRLFAHLPVLGRRADGSLRCSRFGWDFSRASVRPATGWVSVDGPLAGGLPTGVHAGVPDGTMEIRGLVWRLSWPARCA